MPTTGWLRWMAAGRAVEVGVAEGEDAAVGGHLPVAAAVGGGGHAHHRSVQRKGAGRPVEVGVAEGEEAAVGGHLPVAAAVGGGGHAHHRPVEVLPAHRPVEPGVAEGEQPAVGGDVPVPLVVAGRCHPDDRLGEVTGTGLVQPPGQLGVLVEHRPRPLAQRVPARAGDLVVLDDPGVLGVVPGDGDADGPVGVVGDHGRVLQPDGPGAQGGHHLCAPPVVDDQAVGRRDQHVVVAAPGEVGGGDAADDRCPRWPGASPAW